MTVMKTILSAFVLGLVVPTVAAAAAGGSNNTTKIHYLSSPNVTWSSAISPLLQGNGMFLASDDQILLSTSSDGTVNRFHPINGALLWTYQPSPIRKSLTSCHSGITFSSDDSYFIYSIIDDEATSTAMTRVVAIDSSTGKEKWQSLQLPGVAKGTPVLSNDDKFVFLTHNTNLTTVGHFSILTVASTFTNSSSKSSASSASSISRLLFTSTNTTNPYAPVGIYHSPAAGYYDGGEGNKNDILVWAYTAKPTDSKVGTGGLFAFQFPIGFSTLTTSTSRFVIQYLGDNNVDFQSVSKPVLTNQGLSMYYAGARSQWRCWVGTLGEKANYFSRSRTSLLAFGRGTPPSSPAFNTLALSHKSDVEPMVFGGTAALQFASANFNFTATKNVTTNSLVMTEARVSPDDKVVYYIEVDGFLHQASTSTLVDQWMQPLPAPVKAEMTLRSDGSMIYLGDVSGNIIAYQVALMPPAAKTVAPTLSPTLLPAVVPTLAAHANITNSTKPTSVTPGRATTKPVRSSPAPQAPSGVKPTTASKSPSTASSQPASTTFAPTSSISSLSTIVPTLGGSVAAAPTTTTTPPVAPTNKPVAAAPKTSASSSVGRAHSFMFQSITTMVMMVATAMWIL